MKETIICAGKGGVGKTTISTSLALSLPGNAVLIDYDGGHSVKNALGTQQSFTPNTFRDVYVGQTDRKIWVMIIDGLQYVDIVEAKKKKWSIEKYFAQFRENLGMIAYADMLNKFFGVPTDIPTLEKFTVLIQALKFTRMNNQFLNANIIIDVEPTAGLERMLSNAENLARSLRNLKGKGKLFLAAVGAKWPDIAAYLKSDYIKNIDQYTNDIEYAVMLIKQAKYLLICTPEHGPVSQTFEVRSIIEKFGGKVHGYVVNNMRDETHEGPTIAVLKEQKLPIAYVHREGDIHSHLRNSHAPLLTIGKQICTLLETT